MAFLLLTGAGFSRNWGGWLADEAFEYLLGCPEINSHLKDLLWNSKNSGNGFEGALAQLQDEYSRHRTTHTEKLLNDMQNALAGMFNDMDQGFARMPFEFQVDIAYMLRTFLARFDAIFTLNQDLLLERHYFDTNLALSPNRKWDGGGSPGTKPLNAPMSGVYEAVTDRLKSRTTSNVADFIIHPRSQPYFKLHGSSNWYEQDHKRLLIMGGNKATEIKQRPLLEWYHKQFEEYLSRPNARLMIIGYSFGDNHINQVIEHAVEKNSLQLFIIDPIGVNIMDKKGLELPIRNHPRTDKLGSNVIGASRRPLSSTFGNDRVEHAKVMRFFKS
jgi:hypothetical protein